MKQAMISKVQSEAFAPKGFRNEEALLESIAKSCRNKRTVMLTGNYTVKQGPNTEPGDPRLLGEEMLLSIELCARAYRRCVGLGIEPPTILLLPNDIAPGTFQSTEEERDFKANYLIPNAIQMILASAGLNSEPTYFFTRDFDKNPKETKSRFKAIRRNIREGAEKLIVTFESYAQNLASASLSRRKIKNSESIEADSHGVKKAIVPADIVDSSSGELQFCSTVVTITNQNGAPYCSFLAANLFHELERLGFEQAINTFVMEEYPCVDKAAAAYKYLYDGKMRIRNIYLDGPAVLFDNTIF